jgi:alpha-glucuronidase
VKLLATLLFAASAMFAETGADAWLRYTPVATTTTFASVATLGNSAVLASARGEIVRGAKAMFNRAPRIDAAPGPEGGVVLGTLASLPSLMGSAGNTTRFCCDGWRSGSRSTI